MNNFSKKNAFYFIIFLILFITDQAVKIKIKSNLKIGESIDIIENFFKLSYVQNRGAAFGILQDQKWIFLIAGIFIIAVLLSAFIKTDSVLFKLSITLIISGAVGNISDRLLHGYVIDMFDFHAIWPYVFNVADICVVIGIGLLSIGIMNDKS